tara:strand:+ start:268 stop:612 length:345 start_codon:yes stop_codon:yes gene_type:complete
MPVGSNKMNNKILFITLLLLVSTNVIADAANKEGKKYKVDAKCHVEVVGGQQVIYFAYVKEDKINKLADTLVNRKFSTPFFKEKQRVYKVFECVLLDAKFNSAKANQLFDKQPR